jgi:hypothetical protein
MRRTHPGRLAVVAATAVAVTILSLTVSGVIAQGRPAMLGSAGLARGSVVVRGDVLHRLVLDARDVNTLPRHVVRVTYLAAGTPEHHVFSGPLLIDVIAKADPLFDSAIKNDQLGFYVSVTASDGYRAVVAYGEIDPKFEGKDILLATTEDGRSLGAAGPRLVVPGDKAGGRYVSGVASVELGSANQPGLTVSAADALTTAFTAYGTQFSAANAKFTFAGAAELAMAIEKGARPDVFASSNTSLPDMLHAKGLVAKPSAGKLTAIQLPNNVDPQVAAFAVVVVKGSKHPGQAQAFINGLLSGPGQQDLEKAGFVAPSKP